MILADRFAKMSGRERLVLIGSVGAVLLAIIDRLVLAPILDKVRSFDADIQFTEDQMHKDERIVGQKERIESEEKKYPMTATSARSEEEETAALLRTIESLASGATVQITDLKPGGTQIEGPVKKFLVSISCEAELAQLVKFFHSLESSDSLIQIASFSFTPKGRQSKMTRCELMLMKITLL